MTNDERISNDEIRKVKTRIGFGFRISSLIRHWSLVISHFLLVFLFFPSICFSQRQPDRTPPLDSFQAERDARSLLTNMLAQIPDQNSVKAGVLKIRNSKGDEKEIPVRIEILASPANWKSIYEATASSNLAGGVKLIVIHSGNQPNQYQLIEPGKSAATNASSGRLSPAELMVPFAGSDFWLADLGLEFLHWPKQRVLLTDMRHHKSCRVLESLNPQPSPGGYARVVSWITVDTPHAIVHAEAFDSSNQLVKKFDPKNLEKINGQYELESMEIRSPKAGSRTILEFDLQPNSH
jgi:hypothetical protein